jgi:diaminopimelate decarboxylase
MMTEQESQLWWQRADLSYHGEALFFAGHSVEALAKRFGSPSFVYSFARVRDNLERVDAALKAAQLPAGYTLLYAMKANRFAPLLTSLQHTGLCGIDACSPREVEHAVSCGFRPDQISFTAGSLSRRDVELLACYDGLFVDCDSLHAINAWGQCRPGSEIGIRVNPAMGVSRADNDKLQYAGTAATKFGIYEEQLDEALALARSHGLKITKIHFHTGCGYLTPELGQWDAVIGSCLEKFVARCPDVTTVNVGGGLGVPHVASDGTLDLQAWSAVLHKHFGNRNLRVEIEPGEYIVKDSGLLLLGKTFEETKQTTRFVGVDAGFNIAPEPAYYNLPFQPLAPRRSGPLKQVTVVGNINEALDVWYRDAWLPELEGQESLVLINAGAYSASMASNHCMRGEMREFLLADPRTSSAADTPQ